MRPDNTYFARSGKAHRPGARYIRQIIPSGPSRRSRHGGEGPHGEPPRQGFYLSNGPSGALSGWAVKTPVWTAPGLHVAASGGVLCESEHKSRKPTDPEHDSVVTFYTSSCPMRPILRILHGFVRPQARNTIVLSPFTLHPVP